MSRVTVRRATMADIPWLVGELREFSAFFGTKRSLFPGDEACAFKLLAWLTDVPDCEPLHHPFFVAEKAGREVVLGGDVHDFAERVGFIAGLLSPHFLNGDVVTLTEVLWWVPPPHRQSRVGGLLFREFEAFGCAYADQIVFSLVEARTPVKRRTLERRGYHAHETSYLLEVA